VRLVFGTPRLFTGGELMAGLSPEVPAIDDDGFTVSFPNRH
jgi:hypothetical protein